MAKGTTRVHLLATELGVKSKAIVEKCQAEGLDIKNHMATISVGLAATIREWFSEGVHATTVEAAGRVDLKKARTKTKKKAVKKKVVKKKIVKKKTAKKKTAKKGKLTAEETAKAELKKKVMAIAVEGSEVPVVETGAPTKIKKAEKEASRPTVKKPAKPAPPPKSKPVIPAGPMLKKPKPAKLSGPTVIRVEKVEPEEVRRPPKPARRPKPKYGAPMSQPLMQNMIDLPSGPKGKKGDKRSSRQKDVDYGADGETKRSRVMRRMRAKDLEDRKARLAAARGESLRSRPSRRIEAKRAADLKPIERPEKATIAEPVIVKNLSAALAVKTSEIIGKLMSQGVMATANHSIDNDVAEMIALEFGTELTIEQKQSIQQVIAEEFDSRDRKNVERRPPVITMLGHVDHGKTSLLDKIRSASVADGEAGGITQHIGAYQVECHDRKVTFLDTPGHEAFTSMRAHGANMTDIVVLVIAADDGVMPQTIEAIHHAKAANVEILVALNKIDLPGVDINRVYGQLAEHELTPTEWSGNTEIVKTSATTGEGIDDLIEHLDYIAELKDYKADSKVRATGWVIEAKMTTSHGAVATILIKEGLLKKGDAILAGSGCGRIRTLKDSHGRSIKKATSSMPVEISGLSDVPQAGDKFFCLKDINRAKEAAEQNKAYLREKSLAKRSHITLDNLFSQIESGNIKELNIVLKADVQGSVDVLIKYLSELTTDEVKINILHAAVGGVTEGDVVLAEASDAIVIGFNVVADDRVKIIADSAGVDIRLYNIIYRITEDLKDAMIGMLEPVYEEKQIGKATVRNTFKHSRIGTIAGCYVNNGIVGKNAKVRLTRDGIVIRDNCSIDSLKHFKDDVREVKSGLECGIKIAGFDDVKVDDVFEVYEVVEVARTL